jgi:hypothetical protein
MEAMTKNWTDERLEERFDRIDDRFEAIDRRFDEVDRRIDAVGVDVKALGARIDALQHTMLRLGGAGLIALLGLIATQL